MQLDNYVVTPELRYYTDKELCRTTLQSKWIHRSDPFCYKYPAKWLDIPKVGG